MCLEIFWGIANVENDIMHRNVFNDILWLNIFGLLVFIMSRNEILRIVIEFSILYARQFDTKIENLTTTSANIKEKQFNMRFSDMFYLKVNFNKSFSSEKINKFLCNLLF